MGSDRIAGDVLTHPTGHILLCAANILYDSELPSAPVYYHRGELVDAAFKEAAVKATLVIRNRLPTVVGHESEGDEESAQAT